MHLILRWGGVFIFVCGTTIITEQALWKIRKEHTALQEQLVSLRSDMEAALKKQSKLKAQINSQSDIAWIELVLKRELGLIPEGQIKVLFTPPP